MLQIFGKTIPEAPSHEAHSTLVSHNEEQFVSKKRTPEVYNKIKDMLLRSDRALLFSGAQSDSVETKANEQSNAFDKV